MYKRIFVLMLMLICFCGCKSGDPYVRRSEFLTESEQIAQAQTSSAMATLDKTVDTAIEELRSTIQQNEVSVSALHSRLDTLTTENTEAVSELKSGLEQSTRQNSSSIEQNAESISSLESKFDAFAARNEESVSELKSSLGLIARQNSESIEQNVQSISNLESTLNGFVEQNLQSIADLRTELKQLEEGLSQFRTDVRRELSQLKAEQTATTGRLTERVDLLDDGLQKVALVPVVPPQSPQGPDKPEKPSEETLMAGNSNARPEYNAPLLPEKDGLVFWRRSSYQVSFAVVGLMVVLSGPVVAELYARKQRRLAVYPGRRLVPKA